MFAESISDALIDSIESDMVMMNLLPLERPRRTNYGHGRKNIGQDAGGHHKVVIDSHMLDNKTSHKQS